MSELVPTGLCARCYKFPCHGSQETFDAVECSCFQAQGAKTRQPACRDLRVDELKAGLRWALDRIHPAVIGVKCVACGVCLMRNPWGDPEPHEPGCRFAELVEMSEAG